VEKYCTAGHTADDNMAHAHCIPMVKHTHSACVIIIALPLQQYLHGRASMLRYLHNSSLISDYIYLFTAFITNSRDNRRPCEKKSPFNLARKNTTTT
jgi:hypothetical protein